MRGVPSRFGWSLGTRDPLGPELLTTIVQARDEVDRHLAADLKCRQRNSS
jgi:hypothetical protein